MVTRIDGTIAHGKNAELQRMDDATFLGRAGELVTGVAKAESIAEAKPLHDQLIPFEIERVRRAAVRRLQEGEAPLDLLFVLVGGQPDPPTLAVVASPANKIVLLHTDKEVRQARRVVEVLELSANDATPTSVGDGKNALRIYETIWRAWEAHGRPERIGVDVTGGLKIMSAAAAAAAFAIPGAAVYYIDSDQVRIEQRVFNCDERRVVLHNPFIVFGEIRRAIAAGLLHEARFDAAAAAYRDLARTVRDSKPDEIRALLAEAYDDLDKLNFERGSQRLKRLAELLEILAPQLPDDPLVLERTHLRGQADAAAELAGLAARLSGSGDGDPGKNLEVLTSPGCRELVALLLASTDRRLADREYDVASLLAYRASELVVQRRLATNAAVDTANLDWAALGRACGKTIPQLVSAYNLLVGSDQQVDADSPPRQVARSEAFALLNAAFPNDLAGIISVARYAGLGIARNRSLLAHGLQQMGERATRGLRDVARALFEKALENEGVPEPDRRSLDERHRFLNLNR